MKVFSIIREGSIVHECTNLRMAKDAARVIGATLIIEYNVNVTLSEQEIKIVAYYVCAQNVGRFWFYLPEQFRSCRKFLGY